LELVRTETSLQERNMTTFGCRVPVNLQIKSIRHLNERVIPQFK
jgi:hypothetical protein